VSKRCRKLCAIRDITEGKIDGFVGLGTRASVRAFQKAENLPATGQLDSQTAGKLGVISEVTIRVATRLFE